MSASPQLMKFKFLLAIVLVIGIACRFINLDHKVYWYDEAFTSLRVAGYTEAEAVQRFEETGVLTLADVQQFQTFNPDRQVGDVIRSLAQEDPQHPPLFYGLARFWAKLWGTGAASMRGLAAIASLLVFPAVYWLCRELFVETGVFANNTVGWVSVAVLAVSPLQMVYGQEARQYSLWAGLILLCNAALLRALRKQTPVAWVLYAIALAANFYTFLLSALLLLGQGIYVLVLEKFRLTQRLLSYTLAVGIGLAIVSPWLWVVIRQLAQIKKVTSWTELPISPLVLPKLWLSIWGRTIFDAELPTANGLFHLAAVLLMGYALVQLWRRTSFRVWGLPLSIVGTTAVVLMLPDLLTGTMRSVTPRYLFPSLLSTQVALSYWLTWSLGFPWQRTWQQRVWRGAIASVLTAGIISLVVNSQAPTWWNKTHNSELLAIAPLLQQSDRPLLISDAEMGDLLALSHQAPAETAVLLRPRCYTCVLERSPTPVIPPIPEGYSEVFFYRPRAQLEWRQQFLQAFEQNPQYQVEAVPLAGQSKPALWRILPR